MLKNKNTKLEPSSQVCLFVGYPKKTRGGFFYIPNDNKVFVLTNATFLEEDYMRELKPRSKILLEESLSGSTSVPSSMKVDKYIAPLTSDSQILPSQNDLPPRCWFYSRSQDHQTSMIKCEIHIKGVAEYSHRSVETI